jgi:coenzyme Q-binding protein COQ10
MIARRSIALFTPPVRSAGVSIKLNGDPRTTALQSRTIFDSLFSSALGSCPMRTLTHTKLLPHSPAAIFKAVSDVSGYPAFLPFTISSHVTSRDAAGYPTRARLRVGYEKFGLEEDWDSVVSCDPERGLVVARSSEENSNGLFEVLNTRWQISPTKGEGQANTSASVKLDVNVKFRNHVYDQMFAQVEGKVASTMISAFEKRVEELDREK